VIQACDIVTVPDFAGPARAQFEARTLLFLAAWIEYGGRTRSWPLHLACIGEPPDSVQSLAARCGARLSVHAPLGAEGRGSGNKIRGLEVRGVTDHVLLLDTDVLILSELRQLTALDSGIAVAPAMKPRVPGRYWPRIYAALEMAAPAERMPCIAAGLECGLRGDVLYPEQPQEMAAMLPYYNSGVILMPWSVQLGAVWERHIRAIASLFTKADAVWPSVMASDQAGLATAIQQCRAQGTPVIPLPGACHAHWLSLYRNTPPIETWELFHALFVFGKTTAVTPRLGWQLERYRLHLMHRMLGEWRRDQKPASRTRLTLDYLGPALARANRFGGRLIALYRAHVEPALRHV
jgi:hypothetical protein